MGPGGTSAALPRPISRPVPRTLPFACSTAHLGNRHAQVLETRVEQEAIEANADVHDTPPTYLSTNELPPPLTHTGGLPHTQMHTLLRGLVVHAGIVQTKDAERRGLDIRCPEMMEASAGPKGGLRWGTGPGQVPQARAHQDDVASAMLRHLRLT